jgi:hypothetical protein
MLKALSLLLLTSAAHSLSSSLEQSSLSLVFFVVGLARLQPKTDLSVLVFLGNTSICDFHGPK